MNDKKIKSWSNETLHSSRKGEQKMWPADVLIRSIRSDRYFSSPKKLNLNIKILDVGCLYVNNLVPFKECGAELYGTEINNHMIKLAKENALIWDLDVNLTQGINTKLPYKESFFDIVMSINTIHYEENKDSLLLAIDEFYRIGKKDCHYYIMTAGKNHVFHKNASRLDENKYLLKTDDFRNKQVMSYFDNLRHFKDTLKGSFSNVQIATISEIWPNVEYEFYLAKCIK